MREVCDLSRNTHEVDGVLVDCHASRLLGRVILVGLHSISKLDQR